MKKLTAAWCVAALVGSVSATAIAQTNSTGGAAAGSSEQGAGQGIQPGKAAGSMNQMTDPANAGSSAQGSLMQKREQGMAKPQGSEQNKTGEMKQ
jgi:hypothetical protein